MRTVTCHTPGCENAEQPIDIPDASPEEAAVVCGPCGQVITDGANSPGEIDDRPPEEVDAETAAQS